MPSSKQETVARWLFENYAPGELRTHGWEASGIKDQYRQDALELLNALPATAPSQEVHARCRAGGS